MKKIIIIVLVLILSIYGCSSSGGNGYSGSSGYPVDNGAYLDYGAYIEYKNPQAGEISKIIWGDRIVVKVGTASTELKVSARDINTSINPPDQNCEYEVIEGGGINSGHRIYFALDNQILREPGYFIRVSIDSILTQYIDLGAL